MQVLTRLAVLHLGFYPTMVLMNFMNLISDYVSIPVCFAYQLFMLKLYRLHNETACGIVSQEERYSSPRPLATQK